MQRMAVAEGNREMMGEALKPEHACGNVPVKVQHTMGNA